MSVESRSIRRRLALVSFWILVAFQLIMGLLVIRRIHQILGQHRTVQAEQQG